MQYARVIGTVVATRKVKELEGLPLKVLIPCDHEGRALERALGRATIAVDALGAREGDHVLWVSKREASLAIPGAPLANLYPVDAAVTGIIDDIS